jgi:hypothetical protein
MTKNEFKMRALLALCNGKVTLCSTEFDAMLRAAEHLANSAESIVHFDEDDAPEGTTKKLLYDLCAAVEELTCPDGKMDILNDRLLDMRNSLSVVEEYVAKLPKDDEDDE